MATRPRNNFHSIYREVSEDSDSGEENSSKLVEWTEELWLELIRLVRIQDDLGVRRGKWKQVRTLLPSHLVSVFHESEMTERRLSDRFNGLRSDVNQGKRISIRYRRGVTDAVFAAMTQLVQETKNKRKCADDQECEPNAFHMANDPGLCQGQSSHSVKGSDRVKGPCDNGMLERRTDADEQQTVVLETNLTPRLHTPVVHGEQNGPVCTREPVSKNSDVQSKSTNGCIEWTEQVWLELIAIVKNLDPGLDHQSVSNWKWEQIPSLLSSDLKMQFHESALCHKVIRSRFLDLSIALRDNHQPRKSTKGVTDTVIGAMTEYLQSTIAEGSANSQELFTEIPVIPASYDDVLNYIDFSEKVNKELKSLEEWLDDQLFPTAQARVLHECFDKCKEKLCGSGTTARQAARSNLAFKLAVRIAFQQMRSTIVFKVKEITSSLQDEICKRHESQQFANSD